MSPRTTFNASGSIDRFHYGNYILSGIQLSAGLEKHIINTALLINNKVMDIRAHLDGSLKPHNAAATLKLDIDRMDWQALHLINERMQTSQNITVHLTTAMANK